MYAPCSLSGAACIEMCVIFTKPGNMSTWDKADSGEKWRKVIKFRWSHSDWYQDHAEYTSNSSLRLGNFVTNFEFLFKAPPCCRVKLITLPLIPKVSGENRLGRRKRPSCWQTCQTQALNSFSLTIWNKKMETGVALTRCYQVEVDPRVSATGLIR